MRLFLQTSLWLVIAGLGTAAYGKITLARGEPLNSGYLVLAALCTYAIGYRFYSKWIAVAALALDNRRATPCEVHEDGRDFVKTHPWIVFGHHFAAISGPGPLVGPVLAAQFGYLPGTLWILIGVVLGGAVQDFIILAASIRRNGRSLGQMVRDEIGSLAGTVALIAILAIMIILLAVLGLVVVKTLAESPWGVFTVGATIPIALFLGCYLRWWRPGRTLEASVIGVLLLIASVWGGQYVHSQESLARLLTMGPEPLAWIIIGYGVAASILPVWLLLAPRDYLSTFMKLGTILALALGVLLVLPLMKMPPITRFVDGSGLVVAGKLFPFCFITIACGAISGFHALISSGITPKIITREAHARSVGYGAMCLESLVAVMAMIAACTLDPGVYLSMNVKGAGATPAAIAADTVAKVNATGFVVETSTMDALARQMGEKSLYGRTGGAATLAVGMAGIFSKVTRGHGIDLWYHFAIMFEALFILTTLDAGTRVGRYLIQDFLGQLRPSLGNTQSLPANALASALVVGGWGVFLIQGVRDPLGGINSLWPLFGIANQLLAAIALCLGTTVLLKIALNRRNREPANRFRITHSPALAFVTLVPLCWLLAVTFTAGIQKMLHPSPRIGFLTAANVQNTIIANAQSRVIQFAAAANSPLAIQARNEWTTARRLRFNNHLDFVVTGIFLALAAAIVLISVIEWLKLLNRKRPPNLVETDPVWLPDSVVRPASPFPVLGTAALVLSLAREWSGEAAIDRLQSQTCNHNTDKTSVRVVIDLPEVRIAVERDSRANAYIAAAEQRFEGINRCC
ncbi:MAG: carbon starvation protein A [Pedosphaera sp.]|nr:carbon starvation protein A [Pedosphaera sp.]